MPGEFKDAKNSNESDDPQDGQRHGLVVVGLVIAGEHGCEGDEVGDDGDDVDEVHDVLPEEQVVRRSQEAHCDLEAEPDDAQRLDDEEGFCERLHVVGGVSVPVGGAVGVGF